MQRLLTNVLLSSITLIECVNNFLVWSGATIPQALKAVTSTPAAMLGVQGVKGSLDAGADADLVIFSEDNKGLVVDEVWKFGAKIFEREVTSGISDASYSTMASSTGSA